MIRGSRFLVLVLPLVLLLGCKRSETELAPVRGKVFYQGQPVEGGTIVFTPDIERGGSGPQAWARIDRDGNFVLNTDGKPGASPGWHRITVASGPVYSIPSRFRDPELSAQRFEVKPGKDNDCELSLTD